MDHYSKSIAAIRQDYSLSSLNEDETGDNPVLFFTHWFEQAKTAEVNEVNAMTLATADVSGQVHARIVLLKGIADDQFIFFTNYNSGKGQDLLENPKAALLFFWPELQRQVRIEGNITKVSAAESDEYFYSRPLGSQIGAMASPQSSIIASRAILENKVTAISEDLSAIKRPEHWGGYTLNPEKIEFWQGRSSRLHDRIVFTKASNQWQKVRLAP